MKAILSVFDLPQLRAPGFPDESFIRSEVPMSQQAILDTIQLEMNQAALRAKNAPGPRRLVLAPGNYGLDYLASALPQFERFPVVKTSNFIGDTLDRCV